MVGWRGVRGALRGRVLWVAIVAVGSLLVGRSGGAVEGPASRLGALDPVAFPALSLSDAVAGGEGGARLLGVSPAATELGLQAGDVVLRVEGQPLGAPHWDPAAAAPPAGSAKPTFTVWRATSGERQVQEPQALGSQALDEFVSLPAEERTRMRLAVMLANQGTLAGQGAGVVLVPADPGFDSARWLRGANPLPPESEAALQQIAKAMRKRTRMEPAPGGDEILAAAHDLERGKPLEARERAQRAIVSGVREAERRAEPGDLAEAVRVYSEAESALREREAMQAVPEPFFAFVAEGSASLISAFLPQQSLMNVDDSWGWGAQGGVRVRLAPAGVPVASNLFLLAEIGYFSNEFDDLAGSPFFRSQITQYSAELMYRPRVASQLRPYLRGGVGLFSFTGKARCQLAGEEWNPVIDRLETGAIFGGGVDVLHVPSLHLRASLNATYRVLHSKFSPDSADAANLDCANNTSGVELEDGIYNFDLDAVQIGILFTIVP